MTYLWITFFGIIFFKFTLPTNLKVFSNSTKFVLLFYLQFYLQVQCNQWVFIVLIVLTCVWQLGQPLVCCIPGRVRAKTGSTKSRKLFPFEPSDHYKPQSPPKKGEIQTGLEKHFPINVSHHSSGGYNMVQMFHLILDLSYFTQLN